MKFLHILSLTIACLITTGCAQTLSDEAVSRYATEISDECKLYAAEAAQRGQEFIPSYGRCIDQALLYLESKRKRNQPRQQISNRMNVMDIAEFFAKEEAESQLTDYAKDKFERLIPN